jgi:carboxypeptidase C (cathepsin A)
MTQQTTEQPLVPPDDQLVVTRHRAVIGGRELEYTVTAGTLVLREEAEKPGDKGTTADGVKPRATLFIVAYTLDGVADPETRPLTFSFNGGPGSSSVWLHLGLLGPKRVLLDEHGHAPPPPYRLMPNEHSLLDVTDLVFIDPVNTGFSRVVPGEAAGQFHGFRRDIESVGDLIRLYTSRYGRWLSPKYLIGESYGTTRAGGLAGYLQERHGLFLNGLMLISAVLNFQTLEFHPGNDLPAILFLPTYTATAWFHGRLAPELQSDLAATLAESQAFALGAYASALMQGTRLDPGRRAEVVAQLSRLTGLSADYLERSELRVRDERFVKELLREQGRTVGRLDSRFTGFDRDSVGERSEFDPSYSNIQGPYSAAMNAYVRGELRFESDLPYEILTGRVHPWSYGEHENRYVDVAETLRAAMTMNPHLRVYVASGRYDLATPFCATDYTLSHLGLPPELQGNLRVGYFDAGHMMYIHLPALAQLRQELVAFIAIGG